MNKNYSQRLIVKINVNQMTTGFQYNFLDSYLRYHANLSHIKDVIVHKAIITY